ncbi:MAG: DNA-3-methyladenine glycosylase [Planctomycetes bacterium]|nr:DNA-3-methyladenine glycosylase [Planctomycetota bacterium]
MHARLTREFFRRDPVAVARALLGQRLVRVLHGQRLAGLIVETEAYLGIPDKAAHTYNGRRTPRNASMWGDGGHAYVYFTYGLHHCCNVVCGRAEEPVAVLLRALEPTEGLDVMRRHRKAHMPDTNLCSGPAKLAQALAIDRKLDGADLVAGDTLFLERTRSRCVAASRIVASPRIGVDYAGEWAARPLRFHLRDHPHISRA